MKIYRLLSIIWLSLLSMPASAQAQPAWRDLPPEERRQLRQQMREHWAREQGRDNHERSGTPRQDLSQEENRRRWHDIPVEERHRLRQELREQRQREAPGERTRERQAHPPPSR